MNTVPGRIDGATIVVGESRFGFLPGPGIDDGRQIVVGVRPEHLTLGGDGAVKGVVRHVEWLGHEALVTCDVGERAAFTLRQSAGATPPEVGRHGLAAWSRPSTSTCSTPSTTERLGG